MFDEQERMNEMWDEYFAKDDAIRERYASERLDIEAEEQSEREYYNYLHKVQEAGFDSAEEYEASWKRQEQYAIQQGY